ncbi:DgyrCDS228 [Dimorphilus gyrociliatus]|uniref:DgyrCDS228 n=1 Tax=Dimorphilus gyrociliatus TaxID=2664684 RepID=A0A7I8V442_9ANNE|nr:DgyrCDS228 [Dimorphilus gyrociliatus]
MSAYGKKKRADDNSQNEVNEEHFDEDMSSDDDDGGNSSDDQFVGTEINVDFEGRNIEDSDFSGIRKLLQQLFLKSSINLTELSDLIISQNYVGSVLKQVTDDGDDDEEEDELMDTTQSDNDVYGVLSVVNLKAKESLQCIKQLRGILELEKHDFTKSIIDEEIAFIINERFVNIPVAIAPPLFASLKKEIEKGAKKKMRYNFSYYCLISKVLKNKKAPFDEFFLNDEEEVFSKNASFSFTWSVEGQSDSAAGGQWTDEDDEYEPLRRAIFLDRKSFDTVLDEINKQFSMVFDSEFRLGNNSAAMSGSNSDINLLNEALADPMLQKKKRSSFLIHLYSVLQKSNELLKEERAFEWDDDSDGFFIYERQFTELVKQGNFTRLVPSGNLTNLKRRLNSFGFHVVYKSVTDRSSCRKEGRVRYVNSRFTRNNVTEALEFCKEIAKGQTKRKATRSRSPILQPVKSAKKEKEPTAKPVEIENFTEESNNSLYQASFMQIYNTYLSLMLANPDLVDVLASHFLGDSYKEKLMPKSPEVVNTFTEQNLYQEYEDILKSMKTIFPDLSISQEILEKGLESEMGGTEPVKTDSSHQSVFPNMTPPL